MKNRLLFVLFAFVVLLSSITACNSTIKPPEETKTKLKINGAWEIHFKLEKNNLNKVPINTPLEENRVGFYEAYDKLFFRYLTNVYFGVLIGVATIEKNNAKFGFIIPTNYDKDRKGIMASYSFDGVFGSENGDIATKYLGTIEAEAVNNPKLKLNGELKLLKSSDEIPALPKSDTLWFMLTAKKENTLWNPDNGDLDRTAIFPMLLDPRLGLMMSLRSLDNNGIVLEYADGSLSQKGTRTGDSFKIEADIYNEKFHSVITGTYTSKTRITGLWTLSRKNDPSKKMVLDLDFYKKP